MTRRGWSYLSLCLLAGVAIVLVSRFISSPSDKEGSNVSISNTDSGEIVATENSSSTSPFSTKETVADAGNAVQGNSASATTSNPQQNKVVANNGSSTEARVWPEVDVYNLGRSNISDADFESLAKRLNADPEFLQAVINEFRLETDTARLRRLAQLLGDVNVPEVTALASELIFSGDPATRKIGLELLKYIQPGNSEAQALVSGLLATEYEADVLVDTLTALAVPGTVDDETRVGMSEQVALLTAHPDASVRRSSIDILSRWTNDPAHTPIIVNGLQDEDRFVRQTSAYALVGHEDQSYEVIQSLMAVAANTDEVVRVRRGSILALKGMAIDDATRQRVAAIELQLNTRQQ